MAKIWCRQQILIETKDEIEKSLLYLYGQKFDEVFRKCRKWDLFFKRSAIVNILYWDKNYANKEICQVTGMNHCTVSEIVKSHKDWYDYDTRYKNFYMQIRAELKNLKILDSDGKTRSNSIRSMVTPPCIGSDSL